MNLKQYKFTSGNNNPQNHNTNPIYFIIPGVFLIIFVLAGIMLIWASSNKKKATNAEEQPITEEDDEIVSNSGYSSYSGIIDEMFNDAYGYTFSAHFYPSENNTYFLEGTMKEIINGGEYDISGTIVESGMWGRISPYNYPTCSETFAFTANKSILDADYMEYVETLPASDKRAEDIGITYNIDLGYTVSGTQIMKSLEDVLKSSITTDESVSTDNKVSVKYNSGALHSSTDRFFFDKILNDYPGELSIKSYIYDNGDDGEQIIFECRGAVECDISFDKLQSIGERDVSGITKAYNLDKNNNDPFLVTKTEPSSYEEFMEKWSVK